MRIELSRLETPIGELLVAIAIAAGDGGEVLVGLSFDDDEPTARARLARTHPGATVESERARPRRPSPILDRLKAYFAGELDALDAIPVAPVGTEFQRKVWSALRSIPVGRTLSYLQLAQAIDRPSAMRAVGAANGQNPIAIVVPCHRVVASTGKLHGYGGGLWRKAWLLRHERVLPPELAALSLTR
jgi:methylated-DNA-[protein]-cysteine S-methyltransferase